MDFSLVQEALSFGITYEKDRSFLIIQQNFVTMNSSQSKFCVQPQTLTKLVDLIANQQKQIDYLAQKFDNQDGQTKSTCTISLLQKKGMIRTTKNNRKIALLDLTGVQGEFSIPQSATFVNFQQMDPSVKQNSQILQELASLKDSIQEIKQSLSWLTRQRNDKIEEFKNKSQCEEMDNKIEKFKSKLTSLRLSSQESQCQVKEDSSLLLPSYEQNLSKEYCCKILLTEENAEDSQRKYDLDSTKTPKIEDIPSKTVIERKNFLRPPGITIPTRRIQGQSYYDQISPLSPIVMKPRNSKILFIRK